MSAEDNARLLAILEAHGQEFVNSFSLPAQVLGSKRKFDDISPTSPVEEEETSEEEWGGIQIDSEPEDDAECQFIFQFILSYLFIRYSSPLRREAESRCCRFRGWQVDVQPEP